MKFSEFDKHSTIGDKQTIKHGPFEITAKIQCDDCGIGPPWEEHDGHGPVSEWTTRSKQPGEVVLCSDRNSHRYYDWQAAIKIAKEDGWDAPPYKTGTKGQQAERAVKADFERLRAWCRDEWCWVGVVLSVSKNGITLDDHAASLWGIESDAGKYFNEVANELLDEAIAAGHAALEQLLAD